METAISGNAEGVAEAVDRVLVALLVAGDPLAHRSVAQHHGASRGCSNIDQKRTSTPASQAQFRPASEGQTSWSVVRAPVPTLMGTRRSSLTAHGWPTRDTVRTES